MITLTCDAIYILGDFFNFWVGDDDYSIFNEQIKNALKRASRKSKIYLMPGNRDFLLGINFANESGCRLISDPYEIMLYGRKTLLTHGDLLCSKDIKYLIFRNIIRMPWSIQFFLKLPLNIRTIIANSIQKISTKIKIKKDPVMLLTQLKEIKNLLYQYDLNQLIYGHVHIAAIEELMLGTKQIRCFSLGKWSNRAEILIYYDTHKFEFKIFPPYSAKKRA
jgi:UDP-2,3-diacylglucosamine hydrolase